MKTNTVLLSVETYNDLRDFKKEIETGKCAHRYYSFHGGATMFYCSKDETIDKLIETNAELESALSKLKDELYENAKGEKKSITIEDLKKISLWRLLRWRFAKS